MFEIKQAPTAFYIGQDLTSAIARVDVSIDRNILTIIRTEVTEVLKGQGAGQQLIKHIVEFSRANNIKIIVQCPFALKQFEKNPDYSDVLEGGIL